MNESRACVVCSDYQTTGERVGDKDVYNVHCQLCGHYQVNGSILRSTAGSQVPKDLRHRLIAFIRERSSAQYPLRLEEEDLRNPIRIGLPEELRVAEKLRRTLLRVAGKTRRLGELVSVPQTEWPLVGAQDATEFAQLVEHLTNQGYFSEAYLRSSPWTMKVTIPGLDQAEKLSQRQVRGDRAFVAMWFTPETSAAWSQGFEPALRASGFQAIRMDRVQHNEKICDRILAEIRSSNLLVADFTGHRGGVYFEAGFAMGLGVPVVWTCRADHIEALHFDIRQYNQVVWETEIELREKLEDRVKATIPRPLGA